MKKILVIAAAAVVLSLAVVAIVSANAGPHGNYDISTSACAACHRAHSAVGGELLLASNVTNLCYTCHGTGLTITDPFAGTTSTNGGTLNGGGFVYVGGSSGPSATSMHQVKGLTKDTFQAVAFGGTTSGAGIAGVLECISCHNPHGSTNYRILRDADNGFGQPIAWGPMGSASYGDAVPWGNGQVVEAGGETHNVAATPQQYTIGNVANYTAGMRDFCASCHKSYLTLTGSAMTASTNSAMLYPGTQSVPGMTGKWWELNAGIATQSATTYGANIARYRHATSVAVNPARWGGVLPALRFAYDYEGLGTTGSARDFVCTTCHFAHGTSAAADTWASHNYNLGLPGGALTGFATGPNMSSGTDVNASSLLYLSNRGVCYSCHQTDK
ncbi:MAG: hypothetical protein EPO21_13855 [Chloroflexota bacterium]|nr:MAG: hypothetical protein EPO21_13855 [Chloroflexota bacterium]